MWTSSWTRPTRHRMRSRSPLRSGRGRTRAREGGIPGLRRGGRALYPADEEAAPTAPYLSQHTRATMPRPPKSITSFDHTALEDGCRLMRRGVAAMIRAEMARSLNAWRVATERMAAADWERTRRGGVIATLHCPASRAMRAAFNSLRAVAATHRILRRAGYAFVVWGARRALNSWRCATEDALHQHMQIARACAALIT